MTKYSNSIDRDTDGMTEEDEFEDDFQDHLHHPQQRNAANARERARMRILSRAFCRLKTTLPWVPPDTKLSKLDTLRLATSYIAHLRTILKLSENETNLNVPPVNMNWPFNFHLNSEICKNNEFISVSTNWIGHNTSLLAKKRLSERNCSYSTRDLQQYYHNKFLNGSCLHNKRKYDTNSYVDKSYLSHQFNIKYDCNHRKS